MGVKSCKLADYAMLGYTLFPLDKEFMKTFVEEFVDLVAQAKKTKIVPFEVAQWEQEHESFFQEWEEMLSTIDPMFGLYMQVLQALMMTGQFLLAEERLVKSHRLIRRLEKRYGVGMPGSPVLESYFNYWMLFDIPVVPTGEALGHVAFKIMEAVEPLSAEFTFLAHQSIQSRLGFYEHLGFDGDVILMRELPFGQKLRVIGTIPYSGNEGEIWLARPLPYLHDAEHWILGTTPYIIRHTTVEACQQFFSRRGIASGQGEAETTAKLQSLMKHPSRIDFWMRYFSRAAIGSCQECIELDGLPTAAVLG